MYEAESTISVDSAKSDASLKYRKHQRTPTVHAHTKRDEEECQFFPQLLELYLHCNRLAALPADFFVTFRMVKNLSLASNMLTTLPALTRTAKANLNNLFVGGNELYEVPDGLAQIRNLISLDLSFNKLTKLPDFSRKRETKVFLAAYNPLSAVPSIPTRPEEINLTGCGIDAFPRADYTNIKLLHLAKNHICSVPRVLSECDYLDSLDLSFNKIAHFPSFIVEQEGGGLDIHLEHNLGTAKERNVNYMPATCKLTRLGKAEIRGKRETMEDTVAAFGGINGGDLVCIFDGHGGSEISELAAKSVRKEFEQAASIFPDDQVTAMITGLQGTNNACRELIGPRPTEAKVGSTALACWVFPDKVITGNLGDTRAVLGGADGSATRLSVDHRPLDDVREYERVLSLGGFVSESGRVNGILSVSRALGDFFLSPYVSDVPEINVHQLTDEDEFLICGCDGVWDVVTDEKAVQIVSKSLFERLVFVLIIFLFFSFLFLLFLLFLPSFPPFFFFFFSFFLLNI